MRHVVVYGPKACGKTRNKHKLAKHFGCRDIMDDPTPAGLAKPIERTNKTLILVSFLPQLDRAKYEVFDFQEVMRGIGA